MTNTATPKPRKLDQAIDIYKKHLPVRDSLKKREFRALVVDDFKKTLGVTNSGTLGMYFAQCDQTVLVRTPKSYNHTAPRRTKTATAKARVSANVDGELNALSNAFNKPVKSSKKSAKTKPTPALKTL